MAFAAKISGENFVLVAALQSLRRVRVTSPYTGEARSCASESLSFHVWRAIGSVFHKGAHLRDEETFIDHPAVAGIYIGFGNPALSIYQ